MVNAVLLAPNESPCSLYSNRTFELDIKFVCFLIGLSASQVDVLWHCLVCDSESSDDTLEWFLQQAQSKEFHALDVPAMQYIFTEKVKFNCTLLENISIRYSHNSNMPTTIKLGIL